jgi:pyruvate/2-oxoglutarate dehydrogenase complex dihydrolipoamide acyltransferase (E2) component
MADTKTLYVFPLVRIEHAGEDKKTTVHEAGRDAVAFEVSEPDAKHLIDIEAVRRATPKEIERAEQIVAEAEDGEDDEDHKPLTRMNRVELEEAATEAGLIVTDIQGTGSGGAIKNADLIRAIEARRANPSLDD